MRQSAAPKKKRASGDREAAISAAFAALSKPQGGEDPLQRRVGQQVFWILKAAHAWGVEYVRVALAMGVAESKADEQYKKGVRAFLDAPTNAGDWERWLLKNFGGRRMDKVDAESSLINVHEKYFRAERFASIARARAEAERRVVPEMPPPPPPPRMVIADPDEQERSSKQLKRPSGRPRPPALPAAPVQPPQPSVLPAAPPPPTPRPPPNQDEPTRSLRRAFYASDKLVEFESTHPFTSQTATIDYAVLEDEIRAHKHLFVYRAPGLGVSPSPARSEDIHWTHWAAQWSQTRNVGEAWLAFFDAMQSANRDAEGASIIDATSKVIRADVPRQNRGGRLALDYVANGTYNVVYSAGRNASAHLFPPLGFRLKSVVFRVPIIEQTATGGDRERLSVVTAARELANCLNAAASGYGPPVRVGAAVVRVVRQPDPSTGAPQFFENCDLYTVSERLDATLRDLFDPPALSALGWEELPREAEAGTVWLMARVAEVVFAYSVRRVVHLDASLSNFMVKMGQTPPTATAQQLYLARLNSVVQVFAIDLDPQLFRQVGGGGSGWLCLWLYNILFLSAQLKANTTPAVFHAWINQRVGPRTLRQLIADVTKAMKTRLAAHAAAAAGGSSPMPDEDPDCFWVTQARWAKPIGQWHGGRTSLATDPSVAELMVEMKELVHHYFVYTPTRQVRHAWDIHTGAAHQHQNRGRNAIEWNTLTGKQLLPTKRFFEAKLADEHVPVTETNLLVDVLREYLSIEFAAFPWANEPAYRQRIQA
jgi:hypothetical protein